MMVGWQGEAATISASRIERALREIDEMATERRFKAIYKELAETLKIDLGALQQVMTAHKCKVSDLVMACFVGNRTSQPFNTVLATLKKRNWSKLLEEKKIPFQPALEYLEDMQAKIGLILIEHRFGKS